MSAVLCLPACLRVRCSVPRGQACHRNASPQGGAQQGTGKSLWNEPTAARASAPLTPVSRCAPSVEGAASFVSTLPGAAASLCAGGCVSRFPQGACYGDCCAILWRMLEAALLSSAGQRCVLRASPGAPPSPRWCRSCQHTEVTWWVPWPLLLGEVPPICRCSSLAPGRKAGMSEGPCAAPLCGWIQ